MCSYLFHYYFTNKILIKCVLTIENNDYYSKFVSGLNQIRLEINLSLHVTVVRPYKRDKFVWFRFILPSLSVPKSVTSQ